MAQQYILKSIKIAKTINLGNYENSKPKMEFEVNPPIVVDGSFESLQAVANAYKRCEIVFNFAVGIETKPTPEEDTPVGF